MRSTLLSMLTIAALAVGCGDSDKKGETSEDNSPVHADAGKMQVDAAPETVIDAGKPEPRTCDKPETPGNDCADAVGCRAALECGLDTQSCCVKGLDIPSVKCSDGLTCPTEYGRATCDGPEDCNGKACCVDTVAGNTQCLDSCGDKTSLCHTDEDCAAPMTCKQGGTFTWWGICN